VERIDGTDMTVRMDGDKARTLTFDTSEMRHFDHGYVVTSHSSQGLTTDQVLVNMDTAAHPELINTRFAYVSVSRASEDARIYTNDATTLAERLSKDISKPSAVEVARANSETQGYQPQPKEQTMTNTRELTPEEQRRQFQQEVHDPANEKKALSPSEIDQRHYAPLHSALPNEASGYEWRRETGDIQSYQHNQTAGWLHINPQGQFYDRHAQPIAKEHALEHAGHLTLPSTKSLKLNPLLRALPAPTKDWACDSPARPITPMPVGREQSTLGFSDTGMSSFVAKKLDKTVRAAQS
jgi:hypothetical protein